MDSEPKEITINKRLELLAKEQPDKPAFVFWDKNLKRSVLSRQDVWDKSRKCAAFFRRQGIRKGDVVCNTLINSQERLISTYGTLLAGGVSMHGHKFLADGEDIVKSWEDSQCTAIVIDPEEEKGAGSILENLKYTDDKDGIPRHKGLPSLNHVIHIPLGRNDKSTGWLQLLDKEPENYVDDSVTEDDVAMVMTTSGSTGFAKLIPHTHKRLAIVARNLKALIHMKEDSVYYNDRSLGWMGGAPITYPIIGLIRVVVDHVPGKPEDPGALMTHIIEHDKCDTGFILPSSIQQIQAHLDSSNKYKLSALLRNIGAGGGPVSISTVKSIGKICESISVLYGASEFGNAFGFDVNSEHEYESSCCGYAADKNSEFRIVDEELRDVAPGESGEVIYRGPSLFDGYLNRPELNKDMFLPGGWWCTSDIGHMNERGQLFVYCRKSFVINHKGFKHYPGWMEARLNKHPGIQKSLVFGIPDPSVTEQICLCITTPRGSQLTSEDLRTLCESLFLTTKDNDITPIPKYYLFFDSFPLNSNGKVDRKAIKEIALRRVEYEYAI